MCPHTENIRVLDVCCGTGAFLEFCKEKLQFLGYETIDDVVRIQKKLGVPPEKAKEFYHQEVDQKIKDFSLNFYKNRRKILGFMKNQKILNASRVISR